MREQKIDPMKPRRHLPALITFSVLLMISTLSVPALGVVEVGIGALIPTGIETESRLYLVPNASVALGLLGAAIDLWVLPGDSKYFVLPYLQLNLPVPVVNPYAAIGVTFTGDAHGLSFIPIRGQLNIKVGASSDILTQGRIYVELMASYVSATDTYSQAALVVGVRVGF